MTSRYEQFDRSRLQLSSLSSREHDLTVSCIRPLSPRENIPVPFLKVAEKIKVAKASGGAVIFMMGAHVLRAGVQRYLIDLMEQGYISCIATNGAGVIHDYEFALAGATTESVARYIRDGRFGLWRETGEINEIVKDAASNGLGLGEAVGKAIIQEELEYKDVSIFAAAYRLNIPVTVHVGIGYDIVCEFPSYDGAAFGETSYRDFLIFTKELESLEGGVVMNFGSAVMGPEVYLKALAMVRNVAGQQGREVKNFTTLVCDLKELPGCVGREPCKTEPQYYFRPWKTILSRTVADGGMSYYFKGDHSETVPGLWSAVMKRNI